MMERLTELSHRTYVPASVYAVVHLGLGEHERALDCLEKGCDQRDTPLTALKVHPIYDPLRSHSPVPRPVAEAAPGVAAGLRFSGTADLRYALHGIGATTAMFTVVNRGKLDPLPLRHPDRIMRLGRQFPNGHGWSEFVAATANLARAGAVPEI
jgi:hypothetical protein